MQTKEENKIDSLFRSLNFNLEHLTATKEVTQALLWHGLLHEVNNCRENILARQSPQFFLAQLTAFLRMIPTKHVPAWLDKLPETLVKWSDVGKSFAGCLCDYCTFLDRLVEQVVESYSEEPSGMKTFAEAVAEARFSLDLLKQSIENHIKSSSCAIDPKHPASIHSSLQ